MTSEIDDGTRITKEVMSQFEEKNNDDKEERGVFGTDNANALRNLASSLGHPEQAETGRPTMGRMQTTYIQKYTS